MSQSKMDELEHIKHLLTEKGVTMELVINPNGTYTYNAYITMDRGKVLIGNIRLLKVDKKNISMRGKNVWSNTQHPTKSAAAICVEWIDTKGFEGAGYGKLIFAYGVLSMHHKFPRVKYATLDDVSDACRSKDKNMYCKFGFCFACPVVQIGINIWQHGDPGKQVFMADFLEATRREFSMDQGRRRSEGRAEKREGRAEEREGRANGPKKRSNSKGPKRSNSKGPKKNHKIQIV